MALNPQYTHMTVEEYLAYDRASEIRHEYDDGDVTALAGGSTAHSTLAVALAYYLREQLGTSGPCRVYNSDMRIKLSEKRYVFADVVVSCDVADHHDTNDILCSPHLVIEVLSPSTEARDRGIKLRWYKEHPCISEYVLVNTKFQLVEVHRREGEHWTYHTYRTGEILELASLDIHIAVSDLYKGLRIPIIQDEVF